MLEIELSNEEKIKLFEKARKFANKHQGIEPKPEQNPETWKAKWMRTYIRQVKWLAQQPKKASEQIISTP